MEDGQIIDLYWARDEQAIAATSAKYGSYCHSIAYNILASREDAEESVNDTYMAVWNRIPPHRPSPLSLFLGKITRNISLNLWRNKHRDKRGGSEMTLALDELLDCIPSNQDTALAYERKELTRAINRFLASLPRDERDIFVSRYWFLAGISEISNKFGFTESKVKSMLYRTRKKLKHYLTEEGLL